MTIPQVWVSTSTPTVDFSEDGPGAHWELVGIIKTQDEADIQKHIQQMLGLRAGAPRTADFYLSGDPTSSWVRGENRPPFWVAIEPYGSMRPHIHGAVPTFFVSNNPATVKPIARRAPENHPADTVKYVKIPIRLTRTEHGFLTRHKRPTNS